ncbi:MAG: ABC transporter ATP-binding protein [Clostridiales bacterium]|nr:ABC transporter ATP-binding protein [Clostridiales bacterium]
MKVVEIAGLYKSFKDTVALKNIDLAIEAGEIFGLLGPNGAGKTTLINILSMVKSKDKGTVKIFGEDLEKHEMMIKRQMGVVPQELALFEELTAYENVHFFGSLYGFKGAQLKDKVMKALAFVGLEDRAKSKAKTFSGGMKRRLNIACGIVHEPKLVIMDEPTVGIDPQSRNYILEAIKELNQKGTTIIYTTHYMEEAQTLCRRIAIIDRGDVIAVGTKEELTALIEAQSTIQLMVRDIAAVNEAQLSRIKGVQQIVFDGNLLTISSRREVTNLDQIIYVLIEGGAEITEICSKEMNLEDVFLNLTGRALRD